MCLATLDARKTVNLSKRFKRDPRRPTDIPTSFSKPEQELD